MSKAPNTVFLRLEGPLQAWGDNSKFVVRRTMEAPTKSGVIGVICCAMGLSRQAASERLPKFNELAMGVRIDRAGTRWWDYHTVGAKIGILKADGKGIKRTGGGKDDPIETLISRREYLCDASFLVALQGNDTDLIQRVKRALEAPKWALFLGRKSCPPSVPILITQRSDGTRDPATDRFDSLKVALTSRAWYPRSESDIPRDEKRVRLKTILLDCLIEWRAAHEADIAPPEAEVWYDSPVSFDPPVHEPRLVQRMPLEVPIDKKQLQYRTPPPPRPRADYKNKEFRKRREDRLKSDQGLCVFCKSSATTVQHITYRRAGGNEAPEDLRSLCRLCHDAVTMIEYGLGMGLDRINPEDPCWRDNIIAKRDEIRRWRSEEGRRRALRKAPDDVRRELLEEEG